jgi:hypothetical protein
VFRNEQLVSENRMLREEHCRLQETHLKDKAKIQLLISRMAQLKGLSPSPTPPQPHTCEDRVCEERRRSLEIELHR